MNGAMFLTASGFSNPKIMERLVSEAGSIEDKKVAIITTAAEDKEKNKYTVQAKNQFLDAGFKMVDFIDLEGEEKDLDNYSIIYVTGGNTFKLLKFAKERDFGKTVDQLLSRGGIYIGVSAGSIIMCPTIDLANEVEPDPNDVGLKDLSAFKFVDFDIFPHYEDNIEDELVQYEQKHKNEVKRLRNGEAIILKDEKVDLISIK